MTRIPRVAAAALLFGCTAAQQAQVTAFEQKAAPVVASACANFHQVEANPAINLGATVLDIAAPQYGMLVGDVKLAGDTFCATGPAPGSSPDPTAQATWLQNITKLLRG